MNKAVFFDRDGVLNKEIGNYVCRIEDFELLPDAVECMAMAQTSAMTIGITTQK